MKDLYPEHIQMHKTEESNYPDIIDNIHRDRRTIAETQTWLVTYLAKLLEIDPDAIDTTVPFERYGLDSSAAVVLSGDLQDWLGCELEPELLFDYPTIQALVQYLAEL